MTNAPEPTRPCAPRPASVSRAALLLGALLLVDCHDRSDAIEAAGTIELTETDVASTTAGRVVHVLVEEGDSVSAGDTLVTLTQSTLQPDIEQRRARVASAQAELRDLEAGARPAEIERAQAELRSAESEAERTARDAERLRGLAAAGHVSQAQYDAAQGTARVAAGRRDAAREALRLLQQGARPQQVSAARAAVANARAQLAMAEATAGDLVLTAPVGGVVLGRHVEPGEVLNAGIPAASLGDPRRPWIRVYVAGPVLASLRVGLTASVAVPGVARTFPARIVSIATRAEFTPRVALTEKERADLLFGVKLELADSTGLLKPGLPATVTFATGARGGT